MKFNTHLSQNTIKIKQNLEVSNSKVMILETKLSKPFSILLHLFEI